MKQKQRIASQRILALEAVSKLKAVGELFGVEDGDDVSRTVRDYREWGAKIKELEDWIFSESPIA